MSNRRTYLWFCLLLTLPWAATAETGYIIDRVEVGLYESASTDSPILKLLPTGTELEILGREGNLARVREPGGDTGWIDTRYLMGAKPTRQLLNEAEAELTRLRGELETVHLQIASPAAAVTSEDINKLEQMRDRLQAELAAERQRISELKGQLATLHRSQEQAQTDGNDAAEEQDMIDVISQQIDTVRGLWIVLVVIFLIGLVLGIYLLDLYHRRRHGGFRI